MNEAPQTPPLPSEEQRERNRVRYQRPIFVITLLIGMALFAVFMPPRIWQGLHGALVAQAPLFGLIAVFALIALSLLWSAGERIDVWVFSAVNLRWARSRWFDLVMWVSTQIGNMVTALMMACLLFVLDYRREGIEVILGIFTLWLAVEAIKALTGRTRPFLALEGARVVGWKEPGRSFPSGHTSQTFFLMLLLVTWFQPAPWVVTAMYAVAALVGFTRVYVGAHYPRDVLGGALLGSIWAILLSLADPYLVGLNF